MQIDKFKEILKLFSKVKNENELLEVLKQLKEHGFAVMFYYFDVLKEYYIIVKYKDELDLKVTLQL